MLHRIRSRIRFPGLGVAVSASCDLRGRLTYGAGCSIGPHAVVIVPEQASLALGGGVYVGRYVELGPSGRIEIGDGTAIQDRCVLLGDVTVGRHCLFALNVFVSSGKHYYELRPEWFIHDQDDYVRGTPELAAAHSRPVRIEDDCWIGVNSVILAGITVGKGCVVGANSVVTHDLPPYSVAAGVPARVIKARLNFLPPTTLDAMAETHLPYFYSGFGVTTSERAKGRPFGGLLAKTDFSVALDLSNARAISVTARCMVKPCTVSLGSEAAEVVDRFTTMTFSLRPDLAAPLSFSVTGAQGAEWPVCISGVSVH